ncbi:MAG: glycosyltransferase family 2 protein, partial [Roseinatronobacter sp.]
MADLPAPSVGVVIRTKDRPVFVKRALATVMAQTHRNFHIILVNDGGDLSQLQAALAPDGVLIVPQERFTLLNLNPGLGRSAAFNRGVAALQTDFVTCLDDDDTWDADFMSALLAFFLETVPSVPDLGGVGAQVIALKEEIIGTGPETEIRVIGEDSLPAAFHRGEFFLNPLAYACYRQDIYPVQWMMRRDAVLQIGGFPEHFDVMEDRAFMNRFLARWRMAILDRRLAYHHRRIQRAEDRTRNVLLNTLDNPSYDWRYFADLARPAIDLETDSAMAAIIRSIVSDLLSEVNYETSAIWQKVDGEMRSLRAQLSEDRDALLHQLETAPSCRAPAPPDTDTTKAMGCEGRISASALFDLWKVFPQGEHAQYVTPNTAFAQRLSLSINAPQYGLLLHASSHTHKLVLQIPDTGDWAALEMRLDGLAAAGQG